MIEYREEKIKNAICYFALQHIKKTNKAFWQTLLYKYLAFLDFISIKERGKPVLEISYIAYPKGPVPPEIQSKRDNYDTEYFCFINTGGNYYKIIPKSIPDLNYFSSYEKELMDKILDKYSKRELSNREMIDKAVDDSHEVRAWKIARARLENKRMLYSDMFENLNKKYEEELTPAEENFLVYEGLKRKAYESRRCLHME